MILFVKLSSVVWHQNSLCKLNVFKEKKAWLYLNAKSAVENKNVPS